MVIAGFDYQRVPVADGVSLHAAVGGSGDPIVLLHGFPQTHLMWRHVAPELAADHTVICPDLVATARATSPRTRPAWAPDLHHETVGYGHFMAEEAPAEISRALRDLMAR